MADRSQIEWTDATWNPITGCKVVSPGCTNCYAMRLAGTRQKHHPSREGLTQDTKAGPVWTGDVRFNEQWLDQPLRWTKPRRIFVCAHGDLFAEAVPDEWIDRVFAVMALAPQHTFQVLTKRAERMRDYSRTVTLARLMTGSVDLPAPSIPAPAWPLPNVWLGVSAEDQARADERIPLLLDTPAAVRFISAEPLLGSIDLGSYMGEAICGSTWEDEHGVERCDITGKPCAGLDWVIVGGESGPGARPMHPDWARSLRDQCQAAGVPFFFKQWGEWAPAEEVPIAELGHDAVPGTIEPCNDNSAFAALTPRRLAILRRVGKKAAGRLLDGREWSEFPRHG